MPEAEYLRHGSTKRNDILFFEINWIDDERPATVPALPLYASGICLFRSPNGEGVRKIGDHSVEKKHTKSCKSEPSG